MSVAKIVKRVFPLLLVASGLVFSQTSAKERIEVTLIEIPVNVVGRDGTPISGLTRENFEILDEGKKREITHFEAIDLRRLPAPTAAAPLNPAARRNFLLLFDLSNSSPTSILRSREAARGFILNQLGPHDLAAIASYSVESGFRVISSFSFDREMLALAIDTLGHPKFFRSADPLLISTMSAVGPSGAEKQLGQGQGGGSIDILAELQQQSDLAKRSDDEYRRGRIRQQIGSFSGLARVLDTIRGRKQVILLSEGFDARLLHGRESGTSAEARRETDAIASGEIWTVDSDTRFGSTSGTNLLSGMGDLFKRSDVVLHAFDIKGLRGSADLEGGLRSGSSTDTFTSGSSGGRSSNESLFMLSNETGGQFFKNANDLRDNFDDMLRRQEIVYILGFQALSSGSPGKFHNLKVRLRDLPGGARLYHRAGYYEAAEAASPVERSLELVEILMNDVPQEEIDLDLLTAAFPTVEATAQVPVVIEIAGPDLLTDVKGDSLEAEIFVYAFDQNNAVRDFLHQKLAFDLVKTADTLRAHGVKYYGVLSLPPGEYAVKSLVRTVGTERTGFRRSSLRVPDFKQSAVLPPLFLEQGEQWLMVKGAPRRASEVDYPFVVGPESFVPAIEPLLRSGSTYKLALMTYKIAPESLQLAATVQGAGATVPAQIGLAGRTPVDSMGGTRYLLTFSPAGLAPGQYALNLTVSAKEGGSEQVSVPFTIP